MAYPVDYFKANRLVLQFGGMWVPEKAQNYTLWLAFVCYNIFCILYCEILFFPSEVAKLQQTYVNLDQIVEHVGVLITHLMGTSKVITFYWKRAKLQELMHFLEGREFCYENYNEYVPGFIFEKGKVLSSRVTYSFFITVTLVPTSHCISAAFEYYKPAAEFGAGNVTCDNILPYFSFIPFSRETPATCMLAIFYQSIPITVYAWQIAGDCFVFVFFRKGTI